MIELYEWQRGHADKLEEALRTYGLAFDGSQTGCGKTVVACEIARRGGGNVFIVCPKAVIPAWERTLREFGVHPVGVVNYEKLKMGNTPFGKFERKNWKWNLPEGTLIIWDEGRRCFPGAALVTTPTGEAPIRTLQVGDLVTTPLGPRRVLSTMVTNTPKRLLEISHSGGGLICTDDHPIFLNNAGFTPAKTANPTTDEIITITRKDVPPMRGAIQPKHEPTAFLWKEMQREISNVPTRSSRSPQTANPNALGATRETRGLATGTKRFMGAKETPSAGSHLPQLPSSFLAPKEEENPTILLQKLQCASPAHPASRKSGRSVSSDESCDGRPPEPNPSGGEPDVRVGVVPSARPEDSGSQQRSTQRQALPSETRGQWERTDPAAGTPPTNAGAGVGGRSLPVVSAPLIGLANNDGGFSQPSPESCHRSGRSLPRNSRGESPGPEENWSPPRKRVEAAALHQRRGELDPTLRFIPRAISSIRDLGLSTEPLYDIEVEEAHCFFAEGVLVHNCKSQSSQNARMLRDSKGFPLLILSATLAESPLDLRAAFHVANMCDWPKFYPYVLRHGCRKGRFGGLELIQSKREETLGWLHHEIFQKRGSRIRIKDLGDLFPETQITAEAFDLGASGDIQAVYDEMEEELLALSDAAKYDPESNPLVIQIRARQKTELLKVPGVAALTNDFIEEGNSVVIFTNFKDSLEALHERLGKIGGVVYGGQSAKERQDFIDRFQANEIPYMIVNIQAGGEGISLHDVLGTRPRVSLLFPTFNASDLRQALGRVHRAGGKSKSLQRILFAAGTIEEKVCKRVQAKLNNIDMINDGDLQISLNETPIPVSDIEQGLSNSLQMASPETTILDTKPEATPLPEPPRAHSKHSPSSLLYKAACCGWMSDKSPDRDTSAADRGTLGHKMIEERDFTLAPDDEALTSAAKKCADFLDGQMARLKRHAPHLVISTHQEIKVQVLNQFGHIDHLYIQGSYGVMTDYKFSNTDAYSADSPQFWAYGIGVFHQFPEIENLRVQVLLPFRDEVDVVVWNRAKDLERLVGQVALIIRNAQNPDPAAYRIGKHCTYCERLRTGECSKFVQLGEFLSTKYAEDAEKYVIGDIPTAHGSLVKDPAVMARLYRLAGLMEKAAEGWKKAALAMRLEGTDVPGFDLAERKGRREISSAEAAFEAVKDRVSAEDLVKVSKIGIGALEDLWKDSFPRGEKGNSVKQLMERLIDADAISSGAPVQYLAEVKQ